MGIFYTLSGRLKLRRGEDVDAAVEAVCAACGPDVEVMWDEDESGGDELVISGGAQCSYAGAEEIADAIRALSPYVREPGGVRTDDSEGEGYIYVGPEEDEEATESADSLGRIRDYLPDLRAADSEALVVELLPHLDADALARVHDAATKARVK